MKGKIADNHNVRAGDLGLPALEQNLTIIDDTFLAERQSSARFVNNYGFEYQHWADETEKSTASEKLDQQALQPLPRKP